MSINALNGFFAAFGGADKLGSRVGDAYNEMRLGAAMGAARRAAAAEGLALDNQLIEQDTGRVQLAKPDAVYDRQTARRFRQEEGPAAMVEVPQTEKKRRADVMGDTDVEALYLTKYLPEQVKKLRDSGNANVADHLERYVSTDIGQRQARAYAKFAKSWVGGNYDGVARAMEEYQGLTGAGAAKVTHKGDGTFSMSLIDPSTGKSSEYEFNGDAMMGRMGLAAYMDPMKIAERVAENNKEAAANLAKVTAAKMDASGKMAIERMKLVGDAQRDQAKFRHESSQMDREYKLKAAMPTEEQKNYQYAAKTLGLPQETLDQIVNNSIVNKGGGDPYGKATHPQSIAARIYLQNDQNPEMVVGKRMQPDRDGKMTEVEITWGQLTASEKQQHVASQVAAISAAGGVATPAAKPTKPAGAAAGLPPQIIWK